MNIRKWKDSPALKETRDMLEIKLEDKKVRGILNWIFQIAVVLIFGILAGIALFQSVTVQESTMEPTLQVGERFFVNRAVYKVSSPERGDIIVYKTSGSDDAALHIGRVIGLPGDTVQISNGAVLINGEVYNENKNFPEISNAGLASDGVSLESGEYFVLGDNRNNSEDSRYGDIGNINKKYIVGKVWFVISPKDKFGFLKVQWYPGHMTKAKRQMQEDIKLIDLIIELVDARVPLSSRNPDIDELGKNKSRLILLNKSDLADERQNEAWKTYFQAKGFYVVKVDSRNGSGMKAINNVIQEACKEKIERDRRRGIKNRPIRAMVVGIPNVGKSTFINTFAGRACAKTGNKPGVTKGKQWIRLNKGVELLDTPGILWPKFEDQQVGIRLACVGSIKDDILNMEELALWLIDYLRENYKGILAERYQITEEGTSVEVLEAIARARGCLKKQEELDYAKASLILFDDFRSGKMGRITLEWAPL